MYISSILYLLVPLTLYMTIMPMVHFLLTCVIILICVLSIVIYLGKKVYICLFRPDLNTLEHLNKDQSMRATINTIQSIAHRELDRLPTRRHSANTPLASTHLNQFVSTDKSITTLYGQLESEFVESVSFRSKRGKFKHGFIHCYYMSEHLVLSEDVSGESGFCFNFDEIEIIESDLYENCVLFISYNTVYYVRCRRYDAVQKLLHLFDKPLESRQTIQ